MSVPYDRGLTCAVGVTDIMRSIAWYRDVLGCKMLYHIDGMAWCELSSPIGKVNIGLSLVESVGGKGGATLIFGVSDIMAAKHALVTAGVMLEDDIQEMPGFVRMLSFADPDGNPLMFAQMLGEQV
jgi:catechol 2,3-dioxygenase-like lactoylglutathione lyase family enzyme